MIMNAGSAQEIDKMVHVCVFMKRDNGTTKTNYEMII